MSTRKDWRKSFLPEGSQKQFSEHLVGSEGFNPSQFLDMRTIIPTAEFMKTMLYYKGLFELFDCKEAGDIANMLSRLAISHLGKGREQSVFVLTAGALYDRRGVPRFVEEYGLPEQK